MRDRLTALATAAFVLGSVIERANGESAHQETVGEGAPASGKTVGTQGSQTGHGESGDEGAGHASASRAGAAGSEEQSHPELRPLGLNIEAWPFVGLAASVLLGLATAAWLRARLSALLALIAVVMLAFAALDVAEVVHQLDIDEQALAAVAAVAALLHGAAGLVSASMVLASRPDGRLPAADGTLRA